MIVSTSIENLLIMKAYTADDIESLREKQKVVSELPYETMLMDVRPAYPFYVEEIVKMSSKTHLPRYASKKVYNIGILGDKKIEIYNMVKKLCDSNETKYKLFRNSKISDDYVGIEVFSTGQEKLPHDIEMAFREFEWNVVSYGHLFARV